MKLESAVQAFTTYWVGTGKEIGKLRVDPEKRKTHDVMLYAHIGLSIAASFTPLRAVAFVSWGDLAARGWQSLVGGKPLSNYPGFVGMVREQSVLWEGLKGSVYTSPAENPRQEEDGHPSDQSPGSTSTRAFSDDPFGD